MYVVNLLSPLPNQFDLLLHNKIFNYSQHQDSYEKTTLNDTKEQVLQIWFRWSHCCICAIKLSDLKADISVIKLQLMFAEWHSWHSGSAYCCQGQNSNDEAAEICQMAVKDYQGYWELISWPSIWVFKVTSTLHYFSRTWETQAPGKALWSGNGHKRGNKTRSLLSRP